jgi:hypothetical protein
MKATKSEEQYEAIRDDSLVAVSASVKRVEKVTSRVR